MSGLPGRSSGRAAPGRYRHGQLDGEAEILPGLLVVPTPGHTAGHQSLVVRRRDGTVVFAGQSHNTATAYAGDVLAWRAHRDHHDAPLPSVPGWIDRLQGLDPARVVFAHDNSVWEPATNPTSSQYTWNASNTTTQANVE